MREVTILVDGKRIPRGKIIVDEDGRHTWVCRVDEERHLFRKLDAWTLSETILGQLIARDVDVVRLEERRTGAVYEVPLRTFLAEAVELEQRGWRAATEKQYALPRARWRLVKPGKRVPEQLALGL